MRSLCRALRDRTHHVPMPDQAYSPLVRGTPADVRRKATEAFSAAAGPGATAEPGLDD